MAKKPDMPSKGDKGDKKNPFAPGKKGVNPFAKPGKK